jgi:transcriptional regulator with XRE-family HTH domain
VFVNDNSVYNEDNVGDWFIGMFADRLKEARVNSGHTQQSLGELLNVDAKQIWRWENGKNTPDADTTAQISQALQVSADYLLGLTDDPTPVAMVGISLSSHERAVLTAWRKGNKLEAISVIVND